MADRFKFTDDDAIVKARLNATERSAVQQWQVRVDDYDFEFHEGHGTGYPIYIRPSGNTDTSNLPKFDTLNKTAASYHGTHKGVSTGVVALSTLANGGKLISTNKKLTAAAQREVGDLIQNSWVSLALLAQRYWTNTPAPAVVAVSTTRDCTQTGCTGKVPLVKSGKVACPVCFVYQ